MYNRYQGNTGIYIRIPEPGDRTPEVQPAPAANHEQVDGAPSRVQSGHIQRPQQTARPHQNAPARTPGRRDNGKSPAPSLDSLLSGIGGALNRRMGGLETEDLLLLAILYLMYRENGDSQLLLVMAALLLF